MGQQQLILIVLCTIIIGVAIAVGILIFSTDATLAARDALMEDINTLVANARGYYIKPRSMAGGGNSFTGYTIPSRMVSNENGSFEVALSGTSLIFTATSGENTANKVIATLEPLKDNISGMTFTGEFKTDE